jgi:hypothetical protein
MKTFDIGEASLAEYGRKDRNETWVLTRRGKPVAAVVPMHSGMDAETFLLSHHPDFIATINESWASYKAKGALTPAEARRRLGVDKPARKSRRKTR